METQAPFMQTVRFNKGRKRVAFTMLDSTNWYKMKLGDLGAAGVEKLEMPAETEPDEVWWPYVEADVAVMREAVLSIRRELDAISPTIPIGITAPATGMNVFTHAFLQPGAIALHNKKSVLDRESQAYFGGVTECYWQGVGPTGQRIYKVDINSQYPSVMRGVMPVEYLLTITNPTHSEIERYLNDVDCLVLAQYRYHSSRDRVAVRHLDEDQTHRTLFPTVTQGGVDTVQWEPTFSNAWQAGEVDEVYTLDVYRAEPVMREFVDHFYAKKNEAKKEGRKDQSGCSSCC